jgi:hypothetical protein
MEAKGIVQKLQTKIQVLMEKHKELTDQMLEVETNLDRW